MADGISNLLEKVGLTEYEAKTLSVLFSLKEAEAPEISRKSQVPKTRVYDVLDRLTKKNLVIEIHGRPKKFRAIEPENVFTNLINEKKQELTNLEKEAETIKDTIINESTNGIHEKVMKVKDKNDFMKILAQEINLAQNSVIAFTGMGKDHSILKDPIKNASQRKVEIKLISRIAESSDKTLKEYSQAGIDVKGFDHGMNAYIIDDKKVILALSDFAQNKPEYHFTIWPDNPDMANTFKKYFEHAWEQGQKL